MSHHATTTDSFTTSEHGANCRLSHGKRRWSGTEIGTIVLGMVAFWPIGLAAVGLKLFRGEIWTGSSEGVPPWTAYRKWRESNGNGFTFTKPQWRNNYSHAAGTGNSAFDAYKKAQLEKLEEQRRKLDEEQKAFAEYLDKLRQAKDQDEFDRFMAERNAAPANPAQ